MSYRTCYLCKNWNEDSYYCKIHGKATEPDHWCSSIDLIPCCGSCKYWTKNYDYMDQGNCKMYGNQLSSAGAICNAGYYIKK